MQIYYQFPRRERNPPNRDLTGPFLSSLQGDSGGPLLYLDNSSDQYYVVGIVSFGVKCALPEFPGVYTKVGHFLGWIRSVVETT